MSQLHDRVLIVRAPLFPTYEKLAYALRIFTGKSPSLVLELINAIFDQTGTPQNPVDWTNPDKWIDERLSGTVRTLAAEIWNDSNQTLNPRYIYGSYLFANSTNLLKQEGGIYQLSDRGQSFLAGDENTLRNLDVMEGMPKLLSLIAERSPCKRGDIFPDWIDYLKAVSLFSKPSTFASTLRNRLNNLAARDLIDRDGNTYSITDEGISWLNGFSSSTLTTAGLPSSKRTEVSRAVHAHNEEQLKNLKQRLLDLSPYQFEHFVKELLDAMGYQDVHVTKASNDKGVDVVARVQFGITEITEVVQVKKIESSIGRPKIDELRGALPYHKAIQGTIISLGGFSSGAKDGALFLGAAPITLIDGARLLELCQKHQVGLKRQTLEFFAIDDAFFTDRFPDQEDDGTELDADN